MKDNPEVVWIGGELRIEVFDAQGMLVTIIKTQALDPPTAESVRSKLDLKP